MSGIYEFNNILSMLKLRHPFIIEDIKNTTTAHDRQLEDEYDAKYKKFFLFSKAYPQLFGIVQFGCADSDDDKESFNIVEGSVTGILIQKTIFRLRSEVWSCAYSSDNKIIAAATSYPDCTLTVLSAITGTKIFEKKHPDSVSSVVFTPDSKFFISGCWDNVIRIFAVDGAGDLVRELHGHSSHVRTVSCSPDGQIIASGSSDQTLRLWSATSGSAEELSKFDHGGSVFDVSFSHETPTSRIVTASYDGKITLFSLDDQTQQAHRVKVAEVHNGFCFCCTFSTDNTMIVSGGDSGDIIISDAETLHMVKKILLPYWPVITPEIRSVSFSLSSSDGNPQIAAATYQNNAIHIFDIATGVDECVCINKHTDRIRSVSFASNSSKHLLSCSHDKSVRLHFLL